MEICELKKDDEKAWNEYVFKHPESTFYHQIGWKHVVEKSYGHKPYYLLARENREIKGVLPLFFMKSLIFGNKLVSLPFASYGGVIADNKTIAKALIEESKRIAEKYNVNYLELRQFDDKETELFSYDGYYTSILNLEKDPMIIWDKCRKSMRRYVKKAMENNLQMIQDSNNIKEFYNLYSRSMHSLGTPPHSYTFFENLLIEFPEHTKIVTVNQINNPIAAIFLLKFKETIIYGWGASLEEYLHLSPNYLLFWETIKNSCETGFRFFDFGRSQLDTGVYKFKEGWGAEPKKLYYQYYLLKNKILDTSQSNPKRQNFAKIWRKLPLPIANMIGVKIRRNLP